MSRPRVGWIGGSPVEPAESGPECRPDPLKPGLTLSKRWEPVSYSQLQRTQKAHHEVKSHRTGRAAGGQAKALDLGFTPIEGQQLPLYVTEPSQIGVGWFLAQRALCFLELSI